MNSKKVYIPVNWNRSEEKAFIVLSDDNLMTPSYYYDDGTGVVTITEEQFSKLFYLWRTTEDNPLQFKSFAEYSIA